MSCEIKCQLCILKNECQTEVLAANLNQQNIPPKTYLDYIRGAALLGCPKAINAMDQLFKNQKLGKERRPTEDDTLTLSR